MKPTIEPPSPTFTPPAGATGFTKPAGATEVKPTLPERAPKTSYDVDVYDAKDGDTYESISQEWYNSKQYAAALRAYNQNQALQGGRYVNIPPKHILQRQSPARTGGATGTRTAPTSADAPNWSAPSTSRPTGNSQRSSYVVSRSGMTMQQIARETMGAEQRWREIYDLNSHFRPDAPLPAGTELKLPPDAKLP